MSSHTDPTLPSLGASLGSEFDAFGADNLNLTKLLPHGSLTAGSKDGDYTSFSGIMRLIKEPDGLLKCRIEYINYLDSESN